MGMIMAAGEIIGTMRLAKRRRKTF